MPSKALDEWVSFIRNYKHKSGLIEIEINTDNKREPQIMYVAAGSTQDVVWLDTLIEQIGLSDMICDELDFKLKANSSYLISGHCWAEEIEMKTGLHFDGGFIVDIIEELKEQKED